MAARRALTCRYCVYSMCASVYACAYLCMYAGAFVCVCQRCVCACPPCANMVKVGGNQIGYDLGWQVLRAIVITPVWVNHISLCVRPHTLPTWWIRSLNWIKLMRFCSPPKTSYQKWFMISSICFIYFLWHSFFNWLEMFLKPETLSKHYCLSKCILSKV